MIFFFFNLTEDELSVQLLGPILHLLEVIWHFPISHLWSSHQAGYCGSKQICKSEEHVSLGTRRPGSLGNYERHAGQFCGMLRQTPWRWWSGHAGIPGHRLEPCHSLCCHNRLALENLTLVCVWSSWRVPPFLAWPWTLSCLTLFPWTWLPII